MSSEEETLLKQQPNVPAGQLQVKQFNEKEEATVIESLTMLSFSWAKAYLLFPLLSLLSLFIYPICVYWYPSLRAGAFYTHQRNFDRATHLYVVGKGKSTSNLLTK